MALGKNLATGRADAAQSTIMKKVRKPKFVDNGVRHGEYTKQQSGFLVKAPTAGDFVPTHDRKYTLIEEEDTVRLIHKMSDGHRYTASIFFDDDEVSLQRYTLPPLFIGGENHSQTLVPSALISPETELDDILHATEGTRYLIGNMKGRELSQIGFTDKTVHIGQKANVGLRTTDLISRIAKGSTNSINGLTITNPSGTFVARDFYGVDGVAAIRFLSKHDGYSANTDKFGNLHYSHQKKHNREHRITNTMVTEGSKQTAGRSTLNRVIVRGKSRANNDENIVQIDDLGPQVDSVNEVPGGIYAPTAITKSSAKNIGRRMLSMAKRAEGNESLKGVVFASKVQPGDVISYDTDTSSERKIALSTRHDLIGKKSYIDINSVDGSLEDILQRFQEVDISSNTGDSEERNRQYSREEFSTAFGFNIKVSWRVETRKIKDSTGGMSLGVPNRMLIHGPRHLKSTGVLVNKTGVGAAALTVAGTGYSAGSGVAVSGGSGSSCTVDITVLSGVITTVKINNVGSGFALGETLTITTGGGDARIVVKSLGHPVGTTAFTTDGVDATTVIAVGDWIYRGNGTRLGQVSGRTSTSVTVAKTAPDLVTNDEEIFLLATTTSPESASSNLKIRMNRGTYSSRRRG